MIVGKNDFESWCRGNNTALLSEWDYEENTLKTYEIPKTYKGKVHWKCAKGHKWEATVYNRINGTGCPICNTGRGKNKKISLAEWCLKNNSTLCDEWNYQRNIGTTPQSVTYGSHTKVWWKCSKGHEWEAQIKSRTYNHGCPFCSSTNKRAIKGVNDLETWCKQNNKEYIIDEWDSSMNNGLTPDSFTCGSHKRIHWKCSKGHTWEACIKDRTKLNGNLCPVCHKNF